MLSSIGVLAEPSLSPALTVGGLWLLSLGSIRLSSAELATGRARPRVTAHQFTSEQEREVGRKGRRVVSADRDHRARIGWIGGQHRWLREFEVVAETAG